MQNWGLKRIIRLVIGGYALYEALRAQDTIMGILGFVLITMAILNAGCGAQGCGIPPSIKKTDHNKEEIHYEEVQSK